MVLITDTNSLLTMIFLFCFCSKLFVGGLNWETTSGKYV